MQGTSSRGGLNGDSFFGCYSACPSPRLGLDSSNGRVTFEIYLRGILIDSRYEPSPDRIALAA